MESVVGRRPLYTTSTRRERQRGSGSRVTLSSLFPRLSWLCHAVCLLGLRVLNDFVGAAQAANQHSTAG